MAVKKKTAKPKAAAKKKPAAKKPAPRKTASKSSPTKKKNTSSKPAKKTTLAKKAAATGKPARKPKTAPAKVTRPASGSTGKVGPVPGIAPYQEAKGEEYMNDKQVAHFRNILLTWKKELMEEVDRTVHHMQDDAANFPDPNDRATQESEFSMELRARDRERKLIKKIDEALAHLDDNEYGYCEACGVEIGVKRLEARPTATLCIDCKILDEIREKQMG
jgi:DnaK suppressor protein